VQHLIAHLVCLQTPRHLIWSMNACLLNDKFLCMLVCVSVAAVLTAVAVANGLQSRCLTAGLIRSYLSADLVNALLILAIHVFSLLAALYSCCLVVGHALLARFCGRPGQEVLLFVCSCSSFSFQFRLG